MASQSVVSAAHATLTVSTVDTITLSTTPDAIEVLNRNGVGEIYFTVDGSVPTVTGANTKVLVAALGEALTVPVVVHPVVVKLISGAATAYSVTGVE